MRSLMISIESDTMSVSRPSVIIEECFGLLTTTMKARKHQHLH